MLGQTKYLVVVNEDKDKVCVWVSGLRCVYWASEASPTLGCSIEISRDIYIYICRYVVCLSYVKLTA